MPHIASRGIIYVTDFGASGVHIFFVISGFIMVYTSFKSKADQFVPTAFLLRRFVRIYPIYWIYATLYIMFPIVSGGYKLPLKDIAGSLLLLPGYSSFIIGQGWTLSFEVYFYLCFAAFMILGSLKGLLVMSAFFLLSIAVGAEFRADNAALHIVANSLLIEFLAGAWIGFFYVSEFRLSPTVSNLLVLISLALFLAGLAFGYHRLPSVLIWGVPSSLLITGSVFRERAGKLPDLINGASYLGDSSYSLYLMHLLMIGILVRGFFAFFPKPEDPFLLDIYLVLIVLCVTILCVVGAAILYDVVERRVVGTLQTMVRNFSKKPVPIAR